LNFRVLLGPLFWLCLVCRSLSLTILLHTSSVLCPLSSLSRFIWTALFWLAPLLWFAPPGTLVAFFVSWKCLLRIHILYEHWKSRTDFSLRHFTCVVFAAVVACTFLSAIVQDPCRMGVWLGWHICYNVTQVSQGQLRENRNLSSSIRAKAALIYVLSVPVHNVNKYLFGFIHTRYV
jgi:hypothetical protein